MSENNKILNNIYLDDIPFPDVLETLDYEVILQAYKDEYQTRYPDFTADLESEPIIKQLEVMAYREMNLRQRINEAAEANMLARAQGADLENILFRLPYPVKRLTIIEADDSTIPPTAALMETDDALRYRGWLAMEGLSVAGPFGAWLFHAQSASGLVKHVAAYSPNPAYQVITVLSHEGNGSASAELLETVEAKLSAKTVRPGSDRLTVQSANIIEYEQNITLYVPPGAGAALIKEQAEARLKAYLDSCHMVGMNVYLSGIHAAVKFGDVIDAIGAEAIEVDPFTAPYCIGFSITTEVKV